MGTHLTDRRVLLQAWSRQVFRCQRCSQHFHPMLLTLSLAACDGCPVEETGTDSPVDSRDSPVDTGDSRTWPSPPVAMWTETATVMC